MQREIRIVGGGLAGLTLGLLLRREGVPTEVLDAGSYPRPKVCGEFISGKGVDILQQIDVLPHEQTASASHVRFFDRERSSTAIQLPQAAVAVDRSTLDEELARAFQREGGVLRENVRWTETFERAGLVRATGRRLRKDKSGTIVGIKVHARNLHLDADLELHFSDAGYVGLSRQRDKTVNICALFVRKTLRSETGGERIWPDMFAREMGGVLRQRLEGAAFESATFASVAGISLRREKAGATRECRIGDSICMIPPMTGNGMSIALESAVIAAPLLRDYSQGRMEWHQAQQEISRRCDQAFSRRLAFAGLLQKACLREVGRRFLLMTLRTVPRSLNGWFWMTR